MKLKELLSAYPPVGKIENVRNIIRQRLLSSGKRLVIIDDDPTGPQAVHDVRVYMNWSVDTLKKALRSGEPVFFVCTNSRSLNPEEMRQTTLEVGRNLKVAARAEKVGFLLASRSDSTLRGHFPGEVEALLEGTGDNPDGIILAPVFLEAGRYTINDIQYAESDGSLTPVHLTEFSRDPSFSYKNSDLKKWVEEKTGGRIRADDVLSISLETIRTGGPEAVTEILMNASKRTIVVINAAGYEDLEIVGLGISKAEEKGKSFLYRCSASFIKARGGFDDKSLLTVDELLPGSGPGLIIAGSYVEKTTRQLRVLLDSGLAEGLELRSERLKDPAEIELEIQRVSDYVNTNLSRGITTSVFTSRTVEAGTGTEFLATGRLLMRSLCRLIESLTVTPGFVIAKGGITSIELARTALKARQALAIGQILNGVPVWRLSDAEKWSDIPFVVFPGNVGDETALLKAVAVLQER